MWGHRLLLIAFWLLILSRFAFFDPGSPSETLFTLLPIAAYFGLMAAAHRLAEEAEIEFKPIPLLAIYIFTTIGPFMSIWLDRKAAKQLVEQKATAGFLHFARS
jgi:hypothetical protein